MISVVVVFVNMIVVVTDRRAQPYVIEGNFQRQMQVSIIPSLVDHRQPFKKLWASPRLSGVKAGHLFDRYGLEYQSFTPRFARVAL